MQIICIGGWGFSTHVFDDLSQALGDQVFRIDINSQGPHPPLMGDSKKIIITWSLGYLYFLDKLAAFKNVLAIVALAPTQRFVYATDHPMGCKAYVVKAMVDKLKTDPQAVYQDFYKACLDQAPIENLAISSQAYPSSIACLDHLIDLDYRTFNHPWPSLIIHGRGDHIICPLASQAIRGQETKPHYHLVEGNHNILSHPKVIDLIKTFIGEIQ